MQDFEKLGAFYLGRMFDFDARRPREELLMYESKDLTTHALCVGMTGSGKTGLCLALLEEAAIDGIPVIAIDPKGDLGNLLLSFPELKPSDFQPWVEPSEAARAGLTVEQFAAQTADTWRQGLAESGQDGARIARFRDAVDLAIYTPGSSYGLPLTVLRSFDAPPAALLNNGDALRERVLTAVSGLLALLGVEADPLRSREHILLSNIFDRAWREGRSLDLSGLIREIQQPPFNKIGVMDLETIFPVTERFGLAMQLNNLLASPGFAAWMEGEPLDVGSLLYRRDGKPRVSIISIAHLSDAERMFFVTTLLNEVVSWMRGQAGTSSLRALLYMDEVFGYFPPTANPPSKLPMLTLLKQARAFGLGIVLATQNPVDLDYKGLANCGTWFLGRLQTERDKARVLDGLEGASSTAGKSFDRAATERILSGLGNRVFLMNNVHDDAPVVFQSRWALSYLRGPLTRGHIETLMQPVKAARGAADATAAPMQMQATRLSSTAGESTGPRPVIPPGIEEVFIAVNRRPKEDARVVYRSAIYAVARVHYVQASAALDTWTSVGLLAPIGESVPDELWEAASVVDLDAMSFDDGPDAAASFAPLPSALATAKRYTEWKNSLKNFLYREHALTLLRCPSVGVGANAGESEGEFRVRLKQQASEQRDLEVEKLRKKFAPKLSALEDRLRRAEATVAREKSQASQQTLQTALSFGTTLLGAFFGRKMASVSNVTRAASSVRSASKIAKEQSDVGRAEESAGTVQQRLAELEQEFQQESDTLRTKFDEANLAIEQVPVSPRKSDLSVEKIALAWVPWIVGANGVAEPGYQV